MSCLCGVQNILGHSLKLNVSLQWQPLYIYNLGRTIFYPAFSPTHTFRYELENIQYLCDDFQHFHNCKGILSTWWIGSKIVSLWIGKFNCVHAQRICFNWVGLHIAHCTYVPFKLSGFAHCTNCSWITLTHLSAVCDVMKLMELVLFIYLQPTNDQSMSLIHDDAPLFEFSLGPLRFCWLNMNEGLPFEHFSTVWPSPGAFGKMHDKAIFLFNIKGLNNGCRYC